MAGTAAPGAVAAPDDVVGGVWVPAQAVRAIAPRPATAIAARPGAHDFLGFACDRRQAGGQLLARPSS